MYLESEKTLNTKKCRPLKLGEAEEERETNQWKDVCFTLPLSHASVCNVRKEDKIYRN